ILRVEVDGETEEEQLHHRHADDHRRGQTVAPKLQEFFGENREQPAQRERAHYAAASCCSWMNTSSRLGGTSSISMPGSSRSFASVRSSALRSWPLTCSRAPKKATYSTPGSRRNESVKCRTCSPRTTKVTSP